MTITRTISLSGLPGWIRRGSWSLVDQWLFSGANFVVNILLARWLSPDEYGAYALVFAIYLFVAAIHTSLLVEPMLVLGAGRLREDFGGYLRFLLSGHVVTSLAGTALLLLIAGGLYLFSQPILFKPTFWAALSLIFLLLPWLLRRTFYVEARADLAALSSALYLVGFVGGILLSRQQGLLSSSSAFIAMSIGGIISCLPFPTFYLRVKPPSEKQNEFKEMFAAQWAYAKWSGPSSILIWIPINVFYLIIPYSAGLQGTATFKALSNFINPVIQSNQSLFILLLPQLSRIYLQEGKKRILDYSRTLSLLFLAASTIYLLILLIFGNDLLQFLYGGQYQDLISLLPFAALVPAIIGLSTILGSSLRAMEQPDKVFKSYLVGAITAGTIGILLTLDGSVAGALSGQGLSYLVMTVVLGWYLTRN